MYRIIISFIWIIMLSPIVGLAGQVNVKRLNKVNWVNIETKNFIILTDAREKQAVKMAQELENFNYFMSVLLGYKQRELINKVPVILAKNKRSLISLGIPKNYGGVFVKRGNKRVIFASSGGFKPSPKGKGSQGRTIILHELVHLLINNTSLKLPSPPWYNEGIAEYFSTYVEKKDKILLGDMSILSYRFIKRGAIFFYDIDSEALFKTTQKDLNVGNKSDNKTFLNQFYARAASVVHYLNADPKRRKQLHKYLYLLNKGYSVDEVFSAVFKISYSEFDKKVKSYISGKYVVARGFLKGKEGIIFPVVKYKVHNLSKKDRMKFLYSKISMFSDKFLGEGNREKMETKLKKLYPDIFI